MSEDRDTFGKSPEIRPHVFLNREIRRVQFDWEHPKDDQGNYIPLSEHRKFEDIWYSGSTDEEARRQYEEDKKSMMPDFSSLSEEKIGICAYESFTEGTPISPVFPDTPEGRFNLVKYCAENALITDKIDVLGVNETKANLVDWTNTLFSDVPHYLDIKSGKIDILTTYDEK